MWKQPLRAGAFALAVSVGVALTPLAPFAGPGDVGAEGGTTLCPGRNVALIEANWPDVVCRQVGLTAAAAD